MTLFLNEDEVGGSDFMIGYPHLLLCMGVTVVLNGEDLLGAHVSSKSTE